MKKVITILAVLLLVTASLTGCFSGTKEYTCQDLTMTVPSNMRDVTGGEAWSSYTFTLDSKDVAIFALKEPYTDFEADITLEEYADLVIQANDLDTMDIQRSTGDYRYFEYTANLEDGDYRYLTAVYRGKDGFWFVQIAAPILKYDQTTFFGYLDSVKFS